MKRTKIRAIATYIIFHKTIAFQMMSFLKKPLVLDVNISHEKQFLVDSMMRDEITTIVFLQAGNVD